MDQLKQFRPIIERLLAEHLEFAAGDDQIECIPIIDREGSNYLLLELGWQAPRRIYNVVFHVRLHEGKIWVEQDWTREGIAVRLMEAGVPEELIAYGYQEPDIRPYLSPAQV